MLGNVIDQAIFMLEYTSICPETCFPVYCLLNVHLLYRSVMERDVLCFKEEGQLHPHPKVGSTPLSACTCSILYTLGQEAGGRSH